MQPARTRYLILSAAIVGLALPTALLANDSSDARGNQEQSQQQLGSSDNANENGQQNQGSQASENGPMQFTGTVQNYRQIDENGTPEFRIRLQTAEGGLKTIDLGAPKDNQDLIDNIEQGDHISVRGTLVDMDGKHVIVAESARVNGQTYAVDQGNVQQNPSEAKGESNTQTGQSNSPEDQADAQANSGRNQRSPGARIMLDESVVFLNEGDLNRHLILAQQAINSGDHRLAAGELRVAANRIGLYSHAPGISNDARQALDSSQRELEQLADEVHKSGNVQEKDITQAASRAQLALAKYFDARIRSEMGRSDDVVAGYALAAAATHEREALLWSDQRPDSQTRREIHEAMKTADALIAGNNAGNVDQVADNLEHQIDQVDQQLGQGQQQPQPAAAHIKGNTDSSGNTNSSGGSNESSGNNNGSVGG